MPEVVERCVKRLVADGKSEDEAWAICTMLYNEGKLSEESGMGDEVAKLQAFLKQAPQTEVRVYETGLASEQLAVEEALPVVMQAMEIGDWVLLDPPESLNVPDEFRTIVEEQGDTKPMFVTYAVPGGFSRRLSVSESSETDEKHRYWSENALMAFRDVINSEHLPGYPGHASEESMRELPNPVSKWLAAAMAEHKSTGQKGLLLRGYVYDNGLNRMYVKTGAFRNISPMAMIEQAPEVIEEHAVWHVTKANPLSVDFVRQRTEGLRGAAQLSSEGAGMKPELLKMLAELSLADLSEHRKDLVAEIAATKSDTKPDQALIVELGEVTRKSATNLYDATVARETAKLLGCEVADLPKLATKFTELNRSTISTAFESALAVIKNEKIREIVKTQLKDAEFSSSDEVKAAVESALQFAKSILVASGNEAGLGGVDENERNPQGNTVASPFMQEKMGGGR